MSNYAKAKFENIDGYDVENNTEDFYMSCNGQFMKMPLKDACKFKIIRIAILKELQFQDRSRKS